MRNVSSYTEYNKRKQQNEWRCWYKLLDIRIRIYKQDLKKVEDIMDFRSIKLQTVRKLQEQNTGNMLKGWKDILT